MAHVGVGNSSWFCRLSPLLLLMAMRVGGGIDDEVFQNQAWLWRSEDEGEARGPGGLGLAWALAWLGLWSLGGKRS